MKIFVPVAVAALTVSTVSGATAWIDGLTEIPNTDSYHMTPVHVVQARVQSDAPVWIASLNAFGSKYGGSTDALKFRGALDTVNTASVEGALMYVQAEGIDYSKRSATDKCWRKNGMKYVVFYDIVFTQTNETLAEYSSEYGPMLPMDGGQCTPVSGADVFSKECVSLNGNAIVPQIGPFIGGELKDSNDHAPYPNCWWYSFPNTCPLKKWTTDPKKTDECRASTRQGLCEFDKLPDGITCTYNYRILGYVPIDDVVGITAMTNETTTENYADFKEFCEGGGVEFETQGDGTIESIDFWKDPLDAAKNTARSQTLLATYAALLTSKTSTQIDTTIVAHMQALPTPTELAAENPKCYENIKECATTTYGCKRDLYGQICTVCKAAGTGCEVAPSGFTFPTLVKATVATPTASSGSSSASGSSTPAPSATAIATTSSAANVAMTASTLVATFGLSFLLG